MKEIYMDIHAHIIPGVDDGSASMEETMKMIDQAYKEGVRAIIATPHYGLVNYGYSDEEAWETLIEVVRRAKATHPEMRFVMGNEIYYSQGITEDIFQGKARCLGESSYVLVEFSGGVELDRMKRAISEFTFNGFRPIIAHAERYDCLRNSLKDVRDIINRGAYIQINCRSITGTGTRLENRAGWCRKLLEQDLVHFIGSDCHDQGNRKPEFKDAVRLIRRYVGQEKTEKLVRGNILSLIKNEPIS